MIAVNPLTIAVIALRGAGLAAGLAGQARASNGLYALADGIEAGTVTDEHMRLVAEKLKSRTLTDEDWDDVDRRIEEDRARLQSP